MWLWQHKNTLKRHLLWLKLFGVCLFFHCSFLFWAFFIAHDSSHTISVSLRTHIDYSSPILFVPLSQPIVTQKSSTITTAQPKTISHTPTKQPALSTTTVAAKKTAVEKKATTPTTPPKTTVKPAITQAKKETPKPAVPEQKKTPVDSSFDKPLTGHSERTEKKTLEKNEDRSNKTSEKKTDKVNENKKNEQNIPTSPTTSQRIIPENAHISHDYREVEALRRTALLQKELINKWHPPICAPADAACEISFFVDNKGTVKEVTMVKNSGIMMYDLSARHALFAMKMPQWTYGKTLTINFKQ